MIREAIARLVAGQDLDEASMAAVMREIMTGEATPAQIAACITALRVKGETVEEITGAARVMREKAAPSSPAGTLLRKSRPFERTARAGDGIRTRECQLGRLMPYHLATPACCCVCDSTVLGDTGQAEWNIMRVGREVAG